MFKSIREDVRSVFQRDPAAVHWLQVLLCYPGLHAIWLHRAAYRLWRSNLKFPAHIVAYISRWLTGIEIHPAARIGARFFIDHGMGVVIGETAEIGTDVTIYHGVTLGGVSLAHGKRHPTIESGVVIGAGAKILGAITIGRNTRIGANAVVVKDVPPECVVVGIPGRPVERLSQAARPPQPDLQHNVLPDAIAERIETLTARLDRIDQQFHLLVDNATDIKMAQPEPLEIEYMI